MEHGNKKIKLTSKDDALKPSCEYNLFFDGGTIIILKITTTNKLIRIQKESWCCCRRMVFGRQ
jgi:hypothetical protein